LGGGGMLGYRTRVGRFLGGGLFAGRPAARAAATATA
jgi:predicted oxidoreductase